MNENENENGNASWERDRDMVSGEQAGVNVNVENIENVEAEGPVKNPIPDRVRQTLYLISAVASTVGASGVLTDPVHIRLVLVFAACLGVLASANIRFNPYNIK